MTEPRDIEVLEALFVGDDADGADVARVAEAARDDTELRELFDRLAHADRETGGDFEARFGEAWFTGSLDAMLGEEAEGRASKVVVLDERRWSRAAVWLAAAAVVMFAMTVFAKRIMKPDDSGFQARSAATSKPHTYAEPVVRVFCVEREGDTVSFRGADESDLATVRCPVGQEIKLAVRNPDERLRYGAFFGIADDLSLYWYGPSPVATPAVPMPATAELTPIGETIRLDVNHEPGTVRVIGIFSEHPIDWAEVSRMVETNKTAYRDEKVEVPHGVVVRQTFEVTR